MRAKFPLHVFIPELLVARGDVAAFCRKIKDAGAWGVRFFLLQSWSTVQLQAWLQAEYEGVKVRLIWPEKGINAPVYDTRLTKNKKAFAYPNPAYFKRLDAVLATLRINNLAAVVTVGDNCSIDRKDQEWAYPFYNGTTMMSREEVWEHLAPLAATKICTASRDGIYGADKFPYYKLWIKTVIDRLKASGCVFRIEIQNEFSRLGYTDDLPVNWYTMMVGAVTGAGVPPGRLVHSGDTTICLNYPGWYSMHQIEQAGMYPIKHPLSRVMLSGDGGYAGKFPGRSLTDRDVKGNRGVSVADGIEIAKMIRNKSIMGGYELMPKSAWKKNDNLANVNFVQYDVLAAMTKEWSR
jgi:hypothetical protein